MNEEFTGFEKSAPSSRPSTKKKGPVSAWDMDLSPFNRLLEQQAHQTNLLSETFTQKIEDLITSWKDEARKAEKRQQNFQEKFLQYQKNQTRDLESLRDNTSDIQEQITYIKENSQDFSDRYLQITETIQRNTSDLIRPVHAQENLLREGFSPSQLLQPLENMLSLKVESMEQVQAFIESSYRNMETHQRQLQDQNNKIGDNLRQWSEQMENLVAILEEMNDSWKSSQSSLKEREESFQSSLAQQNKQMKRIQENHEVMTNTVTNYEKMHQQLENLHQQNLDLLKQQQEILSKEKTFDSKDSFFWVFLTIVVVLSFLVWKSYS